MLLTRRSLLTGTLATAALGAGTPATSARARIAYLKPYISPQLRMRNAHTGDRLSTRFWTGHDFDPVQVRRVDWFMRDWREQLIQRMDRDLFWGLAAISDYARRRGVEPEILVLSGFRCRKTNDMLRATGHGAVPNSRHLKGQAVDLVIPGLPVEETFDFCMTLELGGVGHYPGNFIHIDTGPVRSWTG